ncbi:retrovirus-related pol polyprotein from transposon TNT 1-94 [Tanacetum coccineum]
MLMCKQVDKGVQLQAEQSDWLADTYEEIDEQELEAHYSYMAKIQEVPNADSGTDAEPLEQWKQTEFERYKAFNDRTVDYDKLERKLNETLGLLAQKEIDIKEGLKVKAYKIFVVKEKHDELVKQSLLTKSHWSCQGENKAPKCPTFNGRPTFSNPMYLRKAQYEKPCLYVIPHDQSDPANRLVPDREETLTLEAEIRSKLNKDLVKPFDCTKLNNEIDELEFDKAEFSNMYDTLLQECVSNDIMCSYLQSSSDLDEITELQCLYLHKVRKCDCLAQKLSEQTEFNLPRTAMQAVSNTNVIKPGMYRIASSTTQTRAPQLTQTSRNTNPRVSTSTRVAHRTNVSRPQPRSNQMKDKVLPNTSQVKFNKTEVEDHPRISRISNQTKSVTACNDSLNSRTSNVNAVCATYGKYVFNSNHDACVSKFLNDVNARTKKPNVVPISSRKPKSQANKFVAIPNKKTVASKSTTTNSKSYYRMLYRKTRKRLTTGNRRTDLYTISLQETTSSTPICLMAKASPTQAWLWHRRLSHLNFDYINLLSKKDVVIGLPKLKYTWTLFLRSKDETPEVLKDFLTMIQRNLQALVISVRTDRGTEFLNKTLNAFFKEEGIEHQTSTPRTPEQNGVVERQNRTLVEATRTMLSASKLPLFFWAEAITTACYTQNRSIIIPTHEKMAYHIINDRKLSIKHLYIFGCTCYLTRDGENLDKMKEKIDSFNEIKEMSKTSVANDTSGLVPQ